MALCVTDLPSLNPFCPGCVALMKELVALKVIVGQQGEEIVRLKA